MRTKVLLAVDGNSIAHRAFHAQAATGLRTAEGRPMWAVRGLVSQLTAAIDRIGPSSVVVGFDDPSDSHRRARWPQYKAGRVDKLETLVGQLELAVSVLRDLGIPVIVPAGLEADDVLASAARTARAHDCSAVLMTSDRDSFALIDDNTSVLRIINGGVEASPLLSPERLVTLLGVRPQQYRDFAALRGDPSDNLPGVRGIGPKTAARLLCALGSARAAFDDLSGGGARVSEAIGNAAAQRLADPAARAAWELNCQVMALHPDVDLDLRLDDENALLPLPADAVRSVFGLLQLPATLPNALRVLAHHEMPDAPARIAWSKSAESWDNARPWPRQRYGRLPVKKEEPAAEQLALFA
ncbi:MAG TPA: 5'-3' exonuclease H3TH domain-containing protein [Jatrophihabitans sp.]